MKRLFCIVLAVAMVATLFAVGVAAVDESRRYEFVLTANGKQEVSVAAGDLLTVTLVLDRTDSEETSEMYAVQAELLYDDAFFEVVESSIMTAPGVKWNDAARRTGGRAFYLNYLSLDGGSKWENSVQMGTVQLRVIGQTGSSVIKADNLLVSTKDGTDSFACSGNDVTVILSSECLVTFDAAGGSEVPQQRVRFGEKLKEPEAPVREGYTFAGWYKNLDKTEKWDFAVDTVTENMTLYAAWTDGVPVVDVPSENGGGWNWWLLAVPFLFALILLLFMMFGSKTVRFDSQGGSPVEKIKIKKGALLPRPVDPVKPGAAFDGWYVDRACTRHWNFERYKVKRSFVLYAGWK